MSLRQYLIKQKTKSGELDNALDSLLPDPNVEKDAVTAKLSPLQIRQLKTFCSLLTEKENVANIQIIHPSRELK